MAWSYRPQTAEDEVGEESNPLSLVVKKVEIKEPLPARPTNTDEIVELLVAYGLCQ